MFSGNYLREHIIDDARIHYVINNGGGVWAEAGSLDVVTDRCGNQWAWWGDPDAAVAAGDPGVVTGSHLDSVPDGGPMDGPLGAFVRAQIGKAGLVVMDRIWDNGFRQITSSGKPINGPDDLRGFKIRVPVSPLWTSLFQAFGAAPASITPRFTASISCGTLPWQGLKSE